VLARNLRVESARRRRCRQLACTHRTGDQAATDRNGPADRDREIIEGIKQGSTATAVLAAIHGRSVSELWAALVMLPIAYGDATLEDLEPQDARKTLASPAVLDPTSLSVLALLGDEVAQVVLRTLPGSQIAQATLEDADRGVRTGAASDVRYADRVGCRPRGLRSGRVPIKGRGEVTRTTRPDRRRRSPEACCPSSRLMRRWSPKRSLAIVSTRWRGRRSSSSWLRRCGSSR
jgi:hypothetical protein